MDESPISASSARASLNLPASMRFLTDASDREGAGWTPSCRAKKRRTIPTNIESSIVRAMRLVGALAFFSSVCPPTLSRSRHFEIWAPEKGAKRPRGGSRRVPAGGWLAPDSPEIQDEVGFILAVLQRTEEAKARFKRAIELDPRLAPPYYHLGVIHWLERDPNQAIPLLETAVKLAPKEFDYRYRLGAAYYGVGQCADAARRLMAAVGLQPNHAAAWNDYGLALQRNGDRDTSLTAFRKAANLAPANLDARNNLGLTLVESGQAKEGLREFDAILRVEPGNLTALTNIAFTRPSPASTIAQSLSYATCFAAIPGSRPRTMISDLRSSRRMTSRATGRNSQKPSGSSRTWWKRATPLESWRGRPEISRRPPRRSTTIALRPTYGEAYHMLGTALKQKGDLDGADLSP